MTEKQTGDVRVDKIPKETNRSDKQTLVLKRSMKAKPPIRYIFFQSRFISLLLSSCFLGTIPMTTMPLPLEWSKLVVCCLHSRLVWGTLPGIKHRIRTICLGNKKPTTYVLPSVFHKVSHRLRHRSLVRARACCNESLMYSSDTKQARGQPVISCRF